MRTDLIVVDGERLLYPAARAILESPGGNAGQTEQRRRVLLIDRQRLLE